MFIMASSVEGSEHHCTSRGRYQSEQRGCLGGVHVQLGGVRIRFTTTSVEVLGERRERGGRRERENEKERKDWKIRKYYRSVVRSTKVGSTS